MKRARQARDERPVVSQRTRSAPNWVRRSKLAYEALEVRTLLSGAPAGGMLGSGGDHESVDPLAQHFAVALSDPVASPLSGTASPQGFSPTQIRHAYGIDQISFSGASIQGDGTGQTVAIIAAFDTPTIAHDLQSFSTQFGLTVPTISPDLATFLAPSNPGDPPRFVRVAQDGSTNFLGTDSGWALETALDVEWVHAIAPKANIMLVEANTPNFSDLVQGAVNFARAQPGVSVVSMSWGATDFAGETTFDTYFNTPANHANVSFVAASGDSGGPGSYPAFSPKVMAVGGTSLFLNGSNNITSETAWSGSGGGISQFEVQPAYQSGFVTQSSTQRTSPDVAFDANSSTGVSVYDSFNNGTSTPWRVVGGTSFSAPAWAGLVAIADQGRAVSGLPTLDSNGLLTKIYTMLDGNFNDITSGMSIGTMPQTAGPLYDLVTGRGSPKANLLVPALVGTSTIAGTVYNDANNNGTLDGESGLSGWTVYADLNNNSSFDPVTTTTSASSDVPKTIPTFGTITSNNVVSGLAGSVTDVNVTLRITHTRDSDLVLTLINPVGTRITLASHVGGSGDNFTDTTFDDSAAIAISLGSTPFSSTFQPASPLSALFGSDPNGTWKLEVADTVSGTGGSLVSWSLQLTTGDPNTTSAVNGSYALANLPGGSYHLGEVLQAPFVQTAPLGGFYTVNVAAGTTSAGEDFGNHVPPSAAPSGVTLLAVSDTGASNSDGVTKLNNSAPGSALQFAVSGTIAGATVTVFADGIAIGSAIAGGSTTTVVSDGLTTLADGARSITAQQTEPGKPISTSSPALSITVDATAPVATIVPVSPDPRSTPVSAILLNFNEAVSGLALADLALTRNGSGSDLLTVSQNVTSGDGLAWTLADLSTLTGIAGNYQLSLNGIAAPITDLAGNPYGGSISTSWVVSSSSVAGRFLFYNQSGTASPARYDGNNPAINAADDNAIATDKVAYLPGSGAATFANVSSYSKGINGIMVDIAGPHGTISMDDFLFKVGNNNAPSSWATAQAPSSMSVRAGAGVGGADRVELIWANGAILKRWLEVITLANSDTGLAQNANLPAGQADAFFFANAVADSGLGDTATLASVDPNDEIGARNNNIQLFMNTPITNIYDYNRDGAVDPNDEILARNNNTTVLTVVRYLNLSNPPASPQGVPATDAGSASVGTARQSEPSAIDDSRKGLPPQHTIDAALALAAVARHQQVHGPAHDWWNVADEQLLDLLARARSHGLPRRR